MIIVNLFDSAELFTNRVKELDRFWNHVLYQKTMNATLLYLWRNFDINNLVINCDLGVFLAATCSLRGFNVYTYEEGIGSYGLWERTSGDNRLFNLITGAIRYLFGNGKRMNESRWLKGCFLYYPDLFKQFRPNTRVEALPMSRSFAEQLESNLGLFQKVLAVDTSEVDVIINKKVLLYITQKEIDHSIVSEINKRKTEFDFVIVKIHPHIVTIPPLGLENIIVIRGQLMAEILISKLLSNGNQLTIFHVNSTAVAYFQNQANVVTFSNDEYSSIIFNYIREHSLRKI